MTLAPANKAGKDGLQELLIPTEEVFGRYSARDLIDGISHARRSELIDEIRGQGSELVAALFAPHSIADLTLIARLPILLHRIY